MTKKPNSENSIEAWVKERVYVIRGVNIHTDTELQLRESTPTNPTVLTPQGIQYVVGDATAPLGPGVKFIIHVSNNSGGWGRGFVTALSKRWAQPEQVYRLDARMGILILGKNSEPVLVTPDTYVINMTAQRGYSTPSTPAIDYTFLTLCLQDVCLLAKEYRASVHCPRIGCGLGGGSWDRIEPLLTKYLTDQGVSVTVYDLP